MPNVLGLVSELISERGKSPRRWLVKRNGKEIVGFIEKYNNTRTESHPHKVFKGIGTDAKYIGAVYGPMVEALGLLNRNL